MPGRGELTSLRECSASTCKRISGRPTSGVTPFAWASVQKCSLSADALAVATEEELQAWLDGKYRVGRIRRAGSWVVRVFNAWVARGAAGTSSRRRPRCATAEPRFSERRAG